MTLTDVLKHLGNYFERDFELGDFSISANTIAVSKTYKAGQYVRIMDSLLNDGVYKVLSFSAGVMTIDGTLADETFNGYIVSLAVPKSVSDCVSKLNDYEGKLQNGVASESIPNYSVTYSSNKAYEKFGDILEPYYKPYMGRYHFIDELSED